MLFFVGGAAAAIFLLTREKKAPALKVRRTVLVRVKPAIKRDLPVRISYPAKIEAGQIVRIRPIGAKGSIRRIFVDKGDRIRKGQRLVSVDCPEFREQLRQAEALARRRLVAMRHAKRIYNRLRPMMKKRFIAQMELDTAKARFDESTAKLARAAARREEARKTMSYCDIRSPFSGEVSARFKDPGAQVRPDGEPILAIQRIDKVRVLISIPERDVQFVKRGLPATITAAALPGKRLEGTVARFVQGLDRRTRTLLAEVEVTNPEGLLKPGMYVHADLLVEVRPQAVLVPRQAILAQQCAEEERRTCTWVYVVRDDRARRVVVKVGLEQGDIAEIREGVAAGDLVVHVGRDLVADGTAVRIAR